VKAGQDEAGLVVPAVTAAQMREVDRLAVEEWGIHLLQMMENAGRSLAWLTGKILGGLEGKEVVVLAGRGNNGGGGLCAARHLANRGAQVTVVLTASANDLRGTPQHQAAILQRMAEVTLVEPGAGDLRVLLGTAHAVVDTLIGYGLTGTPQGMNASLILVANECGRPVMALDVPSGLEATTGKVLEPCIRSAATLTLALPKTGLAAGQEAGVVGELYLADIGIPRALYRRLGLEVGPLFARGGVVKLEGQAGIWYGG